MAEAGPRSARREFGVETVHLDLPPLAGALGQRLRGAGVPVTPERAADFARALTLVRPVDRRRLYWTARAIFVTDRSQAAPFDDVFASVFARSAGPEGPLSEQLPTEPAVPDARPVAEQPGRSSETAPRARQPSVSTPPSRARADEDVTEAELPLALASEEERLASKRFDALDEEELARLYRLMSRLELATPRRRTRRFEGARHGRRVDLRRTLRGSLRTGGDAVHIARRRRRTVRRRLVLLCDISGSMEPYARAYLQFLTSAAGSGRHAEAFAFATRLTRLTRALGSRSPERAIQRAAATAPDWSSGTRIGAALKEFNDRHGRRGMARGAIVVILSDGWERGDPALVGREMERLARLAHKIVWVNPRAGASGFSVGAAGMRAALDHVDALVSGHSFEALGEVVAAISAPPGEEPAPTRLLGPADAGAEEPDREPWPSATPVPGSSVAMPSGHGPSRGRTTPGWGNGER
jgi:uncharacterized protein with von Willebrand factor type A (vWA) domain